ncbi:MAG TPA: isoprenylcysteine carboxylmethyltransferase family protein [Candidatus Angelobacter sp.]|nr:isoprenylcysteine carboxylmethyltransferase family protein [Candidatus Angelobacter sp.]
MKATHWEFENRALLFGMVFTLGFVLYFLDPRNFATALAEWLGHRLHFTNLNISGDGIVLLLLALGAVLLVAAALLRTWASSFLHANVVYAPEVQTAVLVADGPYQRVRNPLYFANILMAVGMGMLMSRAGFFAALLTMTVFCYRLILREEADLQASQGERYMAYCRAVPRLWPSLRQRLGSSGRKPSWAAGFKAEFWYWGFAAGMIAFALTLNFKLFFAITAASILWFWLSFWILQKKQGS